MTSEKIRAIVENFEASTRGRRGCRIKDCSNHSHRNRDPAVSLHHFPSDPKICRRWLLATGSEHLLDRLCARHIHGTSNLICAVHFENRCFKSRFPRNLLHHKAVPTKFLPEKTSSINETEFINAKEQIDAEVRCRECLAIAYCQRRKKAEEEQSKKPPEIILMKTTAKILHDHDYFSYTSTQTPGKGVIKLFNVNDSSNNF